MPTKTILDPSDVQNLKPDFACLQKLPLDRAKVLESVILTREKQTLHILTTNHDPAAIQAWLTELEEQHFATKLYYTSDEGMAIAYARYDIRQRQQQEKALARQAQQQAMGFGALQMLIDLYAKRAELDAEDFIMELVRLAFQAGASDLHFQPETKEILMRLRIDGVLKTVLRFPHDEFFRYGKKLKFIAGTKMNVEHIPQDGRFSFRASDDAGGTKKVDVRASFMPGLVSESTVLRYLDSTKAIQPFANLGFVGKNLTDFEHGLTANTGLILITGPTGSGKTTTLYSILDRKNDGSKKIITLEDPIEYQLAGIQQSQINYAKGYDYLAGLNASLRHDPDIILVGETRTKETAQTVVNAALTGHLVFSTLHTNNTLEAIPRLISMGVQPYLLAPSLVMVTAQRLVRRVCPHCVGKRVATEAEREFIDRMKNEKGKMKNGEIESSETLGTLQTLGTFQLPQAVGCPQCGGSGYKGRVGIMEVLLVTNEIKEQIRQNVSPEILLPLAQKQGFISLQQDGLKKVSQGLTTMEELSRVV